MPAVLPLVSIPVHFTSGSLFLVFCATLTTQARVQQMPSWVERTGRYLGICGPSPAAEGAWRGPSSNEEKPEMLFEGGFPGILEKMRRLVILKTLWPLF